jgi:N-acetylglucosaminyl-diphospho-decaprenol L-rhamnosyltransferase
VTADLATIVVNWNTVDLLDECLASIYTATPASVRNEVVVVDNGSTDGSVEHVRRYWPAVRLIVNPTNQGFCRANNAAIQATDAPLLLLVNTDARLQPSNIADLLRYFRKDPRTAVVGPRLTYADGAFQRWTAGRLPGLRSLTTYLLGLDRLGPWRRAGHYLGEDTGEPFQPEWVSSAVMAVRRAALDEVGLLDENIFVYMDDVDLCARVTAAGWKVWYAADTTAVHFMGVSSSRASGQASPEALRALNRWYVQRHGAVRGWALRAVEVVGFGGRVLLHSPGAVRHRPEAQARRDAHARHLRLALEQIDA